MTHDTRCTIAVRVILRLIPKYSLSGNTKTSKMFSKPLGSVFPQDGKSFGFFSNVFRDSRSRYPHVGQVLPFLS